MTMHLARIEGGNRSFCGKTPQRDGITMVNMLAQSSCGACARFAKAWDVDRPMPRNSYHAVPS